MVGPARWEQGCIAFLFCAATAIAAPAQIFTTLANFDGTDGTQAIGVLVQGAGGGLYGTANVGGDTECLGAMTCGTVYKFTPDGKLVTLHSFCANSFPNCLDGASPPAGLVQATDGNFYGATWLGGSGVGSADNVCRNGIETKGCGTLFKITPAGEFTTIYNFCSQPNCIDGAYPTTALIQAANGKFYGTTSLSGVSPNARYSYGTLFEITAEGKLTTLHRFVGSDGSQPSTLIQATDGNFYGTTREGGAYGKSGTSGTVFKMTPEGKLTTLHSFCGQVRCPDGSGPNSLVQAADGNFYGTTWANGANASGTFFKITPQGKLTTLYTFCSVRPNCADGDGPLGLAQATDGNFYGSAQGGVNGWGIVFEVTAGGTLTTLYTFNGFDGALPGGGLLQATNGDFYGTTSGGGAYRYGTLFSLSVGLGPFVAFVRDSGKVGETGGILGQGFTGTTSVSINGIPATFKVKSDTFIEATVPPGATTGFVAVMTPSGTLTSNVQFHVLR
jgi:uncharacterized repeat protein (TIGR03803 family)